MFSEQFAFELPAIVNFVGGGGKTALILSLLAEQSQQEPILYTTTTRIHPPSPENGGLILLASDSPELLKLLLEQIARNSSHHPLRLVITQLLMSPGLLRGVPPDFGRLLDRSLFPLILNEADGARSVSLKMPRENEPVLMENANYLVPVIGLDCLNQPLGPEVLFRWERAAARYSLKAGEPLTPELASSLLLHPEGVCKDWKPGMHLVVYINKVDTEAEDESARELARIIMQNENFPVERVVWGSVQNRRSESHS